MPGTSLWNSLRAFQLFGANTNVGKTIVSTALLKAIMAKNKVAPESACYIKPVSTGNIMEADTMHIQKYANGIDATCLYQFNDPVSPHLAAKKLGIIPQNSKIVDLIRCFLAEKSNSILQTVQSQNCWVLVETAGGVLSPGPSGTVQADIYRPLRLPVVLIGDSNLGGISSTISSFESLCIRGFDVVALLTLENKKYQNHLYFEKYFKDKIAIIASIASPPPYPNNKCDNLDYKEMTRYYENIASGSAVTSVVRQLEHWHVQRIYKLKSLSKRAHKTIWYPFSQHKAISENTIATIDSAYGDFFEVLKPSSAPNNNVTTNMNSKDSLVVSSLDGSGSWWTQGLGHGNPNLALSAACAAGRYGHVILANTIHEPAMDLAETLLKTIKNPRLSRVFYSDNGSTAIEVAIKMALKASANRYKWDISKDSLSIIGLKRSYHGDTIGSMDCSEPSLYNQQINWYSNNGYWFDYPTVSYSDGKWTIKIPTTLKNTLGEDSKFETINQVFDFQNRDSLTYSKYIYKTIQTWVKNGAKFGAVLFEPVILGAGGMVFVMFLISDPLFQKVLVETVRKNPSLFSKSSTSIGKIDNKTYTQWSGLPIIYDEVFTGLYRLGEASCSSFLKTYPDISVHAKLLTGGLVPLSTTLASENIFETFLSDHKEDALLHGHSYTAHPVGCKVALESLKTYKELEKSGWNVFKHQWKDSDVVSKTTPFIWTVWSPSFLEQLSYLPKVENVFGLGTVLAITLKDDTVSGYASDATLNLQRDLLKIGSHGWSINTRGLGNVLYVMASQTTTKELILKVEMRILNSLKK